MLKLRYSTTSPYVRKVSVVAIEIGMKDRIEYVATSVADPHSGLAKDNPLNKIPALILEDGQSLLDSRVICEYLDTLYGGSRFHPPSGEKRWWALKKQALGDGVLDAAVLRVMETRRPENLRSSDWDKRQSLKITQSLATFEDAAARGHLADWDIGSLTLVSALDYLDFRFPNEKWRDRSPALAKWHRAIGDRPALKETLPRD
ncbi:MAG TPA: glutathione S-transferase N-terminal domain-containing protein [Dongiaceae bacterium]|jgi:glutathione S-transferase|nr:glutathione S-transferase N-terminal domain-containing protein [Dongiaceae bacterium]